MAKVYVVCEDYTNAFLGLYDSKEKATKEQEAIGGYILAYDFSKINYDEDTQEIVPIEE